MPTATLMDIENIVDDFRKTSEETGEEKFIDVINATADYFGAYGNVSIKNYRQLIRFVQENATRNPLAETPGQEPYTIYDFYAHLEGLRRSFRRNNPTLN